jgi:hypothetical protein
MKRKASESGGAESDKEMLSARVNRITARQFRAHAKLKGETVQTLLDEAITEYLKQHRGGH